MKLKNLEKRFWQLAHDRRNIADLTGVCGFFLQVKFATSLRASLAGDKQKLKSAPYGPLVIGP